jgi:hypothetical protein
MMYAKIYFPLSARADANGLFLAPFDYTRDTTFIVGAYCSGSLLPQNDVRVELELASDSLAAAQALIPALAAYAELPVAAYTVAPADMSCVIRRGAERGDVGVTFHTTQLDPAVSYILPLRIRSVSRYEIAEKYSTLFFGIRKK